MENNFNYGESSSQMINKIHLGDSYELIKQIPDKSVDLIVTDPPYDICAGGSGGCFGMEHRSYHQQYGDLSTDEHGIREKKSLANCTGFDYKILDELDRVMKKVNIYIWCNKTQITSLMSHYERKGCAVDLLVWVKTNPIPTCSNKYLSDLEYCVFAREDGVGLAGSYETKSKAWISPTNTDDKKAFGHPTIKPIERIKQYIINSSKEGDVVFDPFVGSGTTCVAAKELGRQYIGFEIDERYHEIAVARVDGVKKIIKTDSGTMEQLSLF